MGDDQAGEDGDEGIDDGEDRGEPAWAHLIDGVVEGPVGRPAGSKVHGVRDQTGGQHLYPEEDGEQADEEEGDDADGSASPTGLLVQGGYGVETEVAQRGYGHRRGHRRPRRPRTPQGMPTPRHLATGQPLPDAHQEDGDRRHLDGQQDEADSGGDRHPLQVEGHGGQHEDHGENPRRDAGPDVGQGDGGEHRQQGRHEDVVEQDEPSGDEPGDASQGEPGVPVHRSGNWEAQGHLAIADGREPHDGRGHQVHQHRYPAGAVDYRAEDGDRGHRDEEEQSVDQQRTEGKLTVQTGLVAQVLQLGVGGEGYAH